MGLHLVAMNVLYPKILGKRLQLNPLAVTLALLFWGWLWGAMGLILAVPITGAMQDHLRPHRAAAAVWGVAGRVGWLSRSDASALAAELRSIARRDSCAAASGCIAAHLQRRTDRFGAKVVHDAWLKS